MSSRERSRISGWSSASSARRAWGSAKTCARIRGRSSAPGAGERMRDGVGVDDRGAEPGERLCGGALAAADAAGEADDEALRGARAHEASASPLTRRPRPRSQGARVPANEVRAPEERDDARDGEVRAEMEAEARVPVPPHR